MLPKTTTRKKKNINIDEFNDFFANVGEKMARNFNSLKQVRVRKQTNPNFLTDIMQSETSNIIESLKTKIILGTYRPNHY